MMIKPFIYIPQMKGRIESKAIINQLIQSNVESKERQENVKILHSNGYAANINLKFTFQMEMVQNELKEILTEMQLQVRILYFNLLILRNPR